MFLVNLRKPWAALNLRSSNLFRPEPQPCRRIDVMKSPWKIIGIVVIVLIVIVIALPFLIDVNTFRPRIEAELSTTLGRQVTVGNLHLSILSGSVSADDLVIADDPAFSKDPFIRAKTLKVGVEIMPLI